MLSLLLHSTHDKQNVQWRRNLRNEAVYSILVAPATGATSLSLTGVIQEISHAPLKQET
jgi:hypothetical protein